MDLIEALQVLRRRWLVFGVGMLLVAGAVLAVRTIVPVQYQASGLMLILLPADAPADGPVNPYLNLPSGLTTTAALIASEAMSGDVAEELGITRVDEYSVALVPDTGPLLTVVAHDSDPEQAVRTRDVVMAWIAARLAQMQREVRAPKDQLMTVQQTRVSSKAEQQTGSRVRAMAGVAAGGTVVVLVAVTALDLLLRRRRRRAEEESEEPLEKSPR